MFSDAGTSGERAVYAPAAPLGEKQVRRELKAWYDKVISAYKKKDAGAFAALFSPDFKGKSWDGKMILNRSGLEDWAKQDMANIDVLYSAQDVIHRVAIKGQEATTEKTEKWKYKFTDKKGEYGPAGKSYVVTWKQRSRSTFVKTGQGWLVKSGTYLTGPDLRTEDGKPLRPLKGK